MEMLAPAQWRYGLNDEFHWKKKRTCIQLEKAREDPPTGEGPHTLERKESTGSFQKERVITTKV